MAPITYRKPMSSLLGAIGKKPCEIKLQTILQDLGNRVIVNKVLRSLGDFREGLRQLGQITDWKWQYRLLLDFKEKTTAQLAQKVKEHNMPEIVHTHALCCMAAYFRETLRERTNERTKC